MDFRTEGNVWKEDEAERIRGSGDDGRHTAHIRKKGEKKEKYRRSRKGAEASADPCRSGAPSFSAVFHRKGTSYARTGGRVYCRVRGGKSRPASRRAGGPGASGGCFYRWKSGRSGSEDGYLLREGLERIAALFPECGYAIPEGYRGKDQVLLSDWYGFFDAALAVWDVRGEVQNVSLLPVGIGEDVTDEKGMRWRRIRCFLLNRTRWPLRTRRLLRTCRLPRARRFRAGAFIPF